MSIVVSGGQLTLNFSETDGLKSSFQTHYSVSGQGSTLHNELEFSWTSFRDWALDGVVPDTTILGLIHRYDPASGWYLTAGRYEYDGFVQPGTYPISGPNGLFDLNADGSIADYLGGLQQSGTDYYDAQYFNDVRYNGNPLLLNTHVRSVRFAWEELKQLHCDNQNNIQQPDDSLFTIRFCSISPDCSSLPGQSLVAFPHMIAAYMAYDGAPLLTDGPLVQNAIFVNKAADFASACPPSCPVYIWPVGLMPKNC